MSEPVTDVADEKQQSLEQDFSSFLRLSLVALALVLAIPTIVGFLLSHEGSAYLGEPYNTDDHMVYAAWMHQAQHGHLLMDNRFAIDSQPGLTVNVYFFAVGQLARFVGIPLASNIARIAFGLLFAYLLYRFVRRLKVGVFSCKLATTLTIVGGGLGFLVWHTFGRALVLGSTLWMAPLTMGSLPTDVWQPEGFVFPSLLTNGLFAVSLCLILSSLTAILDASKPDCKWSTLLVGALSIGLLMNIHSYDVLLVGLISSGLLVASTSAGQFSVGWLGRVLIIVAGVLPGALWFIHVLQSDPVFAARAQTPTYAANFRAELAGYLPLIGLGVWGLFQRPISNKPKWWKACGLALLGVIFLTLILTATDKQEFALGMGAWAALFVIGLGAIYFLAGDDLPYNLILAWAVLSLVAPYFPGLFQRKLAMGMSIPWALLSSLAITHFGLEKHRGTRNLAAALILLVLGGSSIRWILREIQLIRTDVSETTVQPVYIKPQVQGFVKYLDNLPDKRCVVLCIPGSASVLRNESGEVVPDEFISPELPDVNPILSGLAGVYTYTGHWSETPDYDNRRKRIMREFFFMGATDAQRRALIQETGADYIVAPVADAFPKEAGLADLSYLGKVVERGPTLQLIQVGDSR